MSEILKPCPFCGGKNVLSTELQDGLPFIAYCQCGAENEAENWNTRPLEDELRKRIAELEELVDELVDSGDNLFDSLNPIAWKHEWLDKWWKLSNRIRKEREE